MTEPLYDVKVRRDRDRAHNPSAPRPMRQYADIRDDEEAVALLLNHEYLEVTATYARFRKDPKGRDDFHRYPGDPVFGLYVTVVVISIDPADEDYLEGGINRHAEVSWGPCMRTNIRDEEAAVMAKVMARAAQLAALADYHLRVLWYQQHQRELERGMA